MTRTDRQSARMSKLTHDGLTWSGTGCFIAVPRDSARFYVLGGVVKPPGGEVRESA